MTPKPPALMSEELTEPSDADILDWMEAHPEDARNLMGWMCDDAEDDLRTEARQRMRS